MEATLNMSMSRPHSMPSFEEAEPLGPGDKAFLEDVVAVLSTEAKRRREAAEAFAEAGRTDSADKERAEAAVIADYLPEQLSEDEIRDLVASVIAELGVADDGMKAMGRVMGTLQPQVKGRADGGAVAAEVRRQLG